MRTSLCAGYAESKAAAPVSARHSQIYPELSKLEKARYVTHDRVAQESRPGKKVFEIAA